MARRLLGLGSVFGKTVRDSRIPAIVVAVLLGVMVAAGGVVMADTYSTAAARAELGAMSRDMPALLRGMYGNPINVDTLGGFISWHYGTYFALLAGLWSILPCRPSSRERRGEGAWTSPSPRPAPGARSRWRRSPGTPRRSASPSPSSRSSRGRRASPNRPAR
jgi:hypothetical protein